MEQLNIMNMKIKIITIIFSAFSILCYSQSTHKYNSYGESFEKEGIVDYKSQKELFLKNPNNSIKLKGDVISSCPMKGCWMRMAVEEDTILVRFKNYGFFVPKFGIEGKSAIVNGNISVDTLTVAQLRHYAEDAGKSPFEINSIIEPEVTISFIADGVIINE